MLETPPTIRRPRLDELPNTLELFERLKRLDDANIVEGFTMKYNSTHDLPFKFYAEINIDNSRLWNLFIMLVNPLPDKLSCVYNLYEEEPIYGSYWKKNLTLKFLENYKTELTQDCNLEFGIVYQDKTKLEEVFISDSKYLMVWGNDEILFKQIMVDFYLKEISNLNFIDEFPKVIEPLTQFNKSVKSTETVIEELNNYFKPKEK